MQLYVVTWRLAPIVPLVRPLLIYASFSLLGSETGKFQSEVVFKANLLLFLSMKEILKGNNNQVSWLPSVTAITFSVFPCPRAPAHRKAAGYLVWGAVGFWLLPAPSAGAPAAGRAVAGSPGWSPCVPASCLWVSAGLALRGFKKWRERQVSNNLGNGLPLGFSSPRPKK